MSDGSGSASGRREEILRAAEHLFAVQGFRETSLNDVAEELGFRRQAVYHYFRSKDELLYELIDRAGLALAAAATPTFESGLPPAQILADVVRNHVRGLLAAPDVFRIQFAELGKLSGERADAIRASIEAYVRRVADVVAAGQAEGVFGDGPPMALALIVMGQCNFTLEWHSDDSRWEVEDIADLCARTAVAAVSRGGAT